MLGRAVLSLKEFWNTRRVCCVENKGLNSSEFCFSTVASEEAHQTSANNSPLTIAPTIGFTASDVGNSIHPTLAGAIGRAVFH